MRRCPPAHRPHIPPPIPVCLQQTGRQLDGCQRKAISGPHPADIRLDAAAAGRPNLPRRVAQPRRCPQPHLVPARPDGRCRFVQLRVSAAVAVVGQEPAGRQPVCRVVVGDGHHVARVAVLAWLVVAVAVAQLQAPHRRHERPPADPRVCLEDGWQPGAQQEEPVQPVLVVPQRRARGRAGKVVEAHGKGVAQHAVAGRGHVEGRGVGAAARIPAATLLDDQRRPRVHKAPVLHAAAKDLLACLHLQRLPRAGRVPLHGRRLGPHQHPAAVKQRERQRALVRAQRHVGRGQRIPARLLGHTHGRELKVRAQNHLVTRGVAGRARGKQPQPHNVVAVEDHVHPRRVGKDADVVACAHQPRDGAQRSRRNHRARRPAHVRRHRDHRARRRGSRKQPLLVGADRAVATVELDAEVGLVQVQAVARRHVHQLLAALVVAERLRRCPAAAAVAGLQLQRRRPRVGIHIAAHRDAQPRHVARDQPGLVGKDKDLRPHPRIAVKHPNVRARTGLVRLHAQRRWTEHSWRRGLGRRPLGPHGRALVRRIQGEGCNQRCKENTHAEQHRNPHRWEEKKR
eukprot:m.189492 g.189492  ORF g.189492 m.189492 type:complete len:570 (-) comp15429_c0_seq2:177-1886(-)